MPFPQLYTITSYSLLSSTIRIPEFVKKARELGYQTLAITDNNVLYGALAFYEACIQEGIQPIIGMSLAYSFSEIADTKVLLYAKNRQGYQHLMRISSLKMMAEGTFSFEEFQMYLQDLALVLPAAQLKILDASQRAALIQTFLAAADPASLYLGATREDHAQTLPDLFAYADEQQLLTVALQEVRYLTKEEAFSLQVLTHIKARTLLAETAIHPSADRHLLSPEEASAPFGAETLHNTQQLAQSCQLKLQLHQTLLPHFPIASDQKAADFLKELCFRLLPKRVKSPTSTYYARLEKELAIIHRMGFDDYFLIIWDVIDFAHRHQIVTGAGRGSAAGSLVAYVLSITDVDPIHYDLLFERFLNPERHSMPDIDLDIPDNRREDVLQYVQKKYGLTHMAQIATFGTMAAKMVLRDVARVFGLTQVQANQWANAVPNVLKITLKQAYDTSPKLAALVEQSEQNKRLFETARYLEGLPRHVSTHAAGIVISDQDLLDLIPVQKGANHILLTQFTMNDVEKIGLLKMDFLGLRNLSIIDNTLRTIQKTMHQTLTLSQIPLNDPKTLALFQRGETSGIFQFESAGIKNVLRKLKPTSIEDIAAVNALYRPGPMQNIDAFIRRKKGQEAIVYPVPELAEILENTYGIIVYQEQIMQVASKMAGFTLSQADILRRAISKKKKSILDEERLHFTKGALQKGYSEQAAHQVYDYIERFANYGFNRSHAFAYSFIGFQMAYLKVHFPGAFYVALFQSTSHHTTKMKEYMNEARKNQLTILPPSINDSQAHFYLKTPTEIVFGFNAVKGLRKEFIQAILTERKQNGLYQSMDQFLLRLPEKWLKPDMLTPLIAIGAFDALAPNRKQLMTELADKIKNIMISGGSDDLFQTLALKEEATPDYTLDEKLAFEEQYTGMYLSGHPTEEFKKLRLAKNVKYVQDLVINESAALLLYLKDIRIIRTKKGEQMAFAQGDDETGQIELTLFPTVFRAILQTIEKNHVYYVEGKVEKSNYNQKQQFIVRKLEKAALINPTIQEKICFLKITQEKETPIILKQIENILQNYKGKRPVLLYFESNGTKRMLGKEFWVSESETLKVQLIQILGTGNVIFQ